MRFSAHHPCSSLTLVRSDHTIVKPGQQSEAGIVTVVAHDASVFAVEEHAQAENPVATPTTAQRTSY
jgi:hypothetical protein